MWKFCKSFLIFCISFYIVSYEDVFNLLPGISLRLQAAEPALGQHEPLQFYLDCKASGNIRNFRRQKTQCHVVSDPIRSSSWRVEARASERFVHRRSEREERPWGDSHEAGEPLETHMATASCSHRQTCHMARHVAVDSVGPLASPGK